MPQSLVILGRQPELGLAELESLYGASAVEPLLPYAARLHIDACTVDMSRLGGVLKLCKVLTELDTTEWYKIEQFLIRVSPAQATRMPEGKMHLGLSVYLPGVDTKQLLATGLKIKKAIRQDSSRSVHLVPNKTPQLNTAQVIHNKLTTPNGWELTLVPNGTKTIVAQTVSVQDIDAYAARDFARPKRDARVGMLPPKLAQIIINLATGPAEFAVAKDHLSTGICLSEADTTSLRTSRHAARLLDPFCGTGVILQEAALMGYTTYGTDLETRMIDYARVNLEWLQEQYPTRPVDTSLAAGDATTFRWQAPLDIIASETYLGRPFTRQPDAETLSQTITECNLILRKFLQNIRSQLSSGTRLCLAIPAWQTRPGYFRHLPLIDQLSDLGYNQLRFEHRRGDNLIYYRTDQIVARQLLVLTKV